MKFKLQDFGFVCVVKNIVWITGLGFLRDVIESNLPHGIAVFPIVDSPFLFRVTFNK